MSETHESTVFPTMLRRLSLGVGSSALSQALSAARTIVLVPFFLRAWGSDRYGHWLALTALSSHFSLLDLGGQSYIGNLLAAHHSRGDVVGFREKLSEGVSLFSMIACVSFAVTAIAIAVCGVVTLPTLGRPLAHWEIAVLLLLAANGLLFAVPGGVYVTVYRASSRFSRGEMVGNVGRIVSLGLSILVLELHETPVTFAAATLAVSAAVTVAMVWDTRRCIPGCREISLGWSEVKAGRPHIAGSVYFWLISVAQTVRQQGILLAVAIFGTPATVALYATHRTLANIPAYIGQLVQSPFLPEMTFLWASQRLEALRRVTFAAVKTISVVTGVVAVMLWLAAPLVFPYWTSHRLEFQRVLTGVLLVQAVLAAGWSTTTWGLLASNQHRSVALWSSLNAVCAIGASMWLARPYGAVGVALAGVASDILCGMIVFPRLASSFLRVSTARVYAELAKSVAMLTGFLVLAALAAVTFTGWWSVAAFVLACVGSTFSLSLFIVGPNEARRRFSEIRAAWS